MSCAWCGKGLDYYIHAAPNYHDSCLKQKLCIKAAKIAKKLEKNNKPMLTVV